MSKPKRHHTAPRVYLKNFADSDGILSVLSKRTGKNIRLKPEKALIRYHYYSQPVDGVENADQTLETVLFGELETQYPALFDALINDIGRVDVEVLIQTILAMHVRSPGFREAFEIGLANFVDKHFKSMPRSAFPPPPKGHEDIWDKVVVAIDPHRSLHAMVHYMNNYSSLLAHMSYRVYVAPNCQSFLTSDNPVVWYEIHYGRSTPTVFTFSPTKRTRVIFPISPTVALIGKLSETAEFQIKEQQRIASRAQTRELNEIQLACAWDHVVGRSRLPRESFRRLGKLAPKYAIEDYQPENDHFSLSSIELSKFEKKHKLKYNKK